MKTKCIAILCITILLIGSFPGCAQKSRPDVEAKIDELISKLEYRYWETSVDSLVEIGEPAVDPLIKALNDTKASTDG